jgi:hypothetical protein
MRTPSSPPTSFLSIALLCGGVALGGACSAAGEDGSGVGASGSGGGPGSGGEASGGSTSSGFGVGGGPIEGAGCSADLQYVVDDQGNTIQACPPDQGCAGGQCVPACDAAAQAKGSIGCEYWAPTSPFYVNESPNPTTYDGACHAVFVANTWGRHAKLTMRRGGTALEPTLFGYVPSGIGAATTYTPLTAEGIPPGQVAVLFLSHKPGAQHGLGTSLECPRAPALPLDTAVQGSGAGEAFEIVSDTPITAYDILPYGGAMSYLPSASLLTPRTAWGTNYYAVAPHPLGGGALWMLVVGSQDGTQLTLSPAQTLPGGGTVPGAPSGSPTTVTLGAGQVFQWLGADPTSTVLQATAPVGVYTGSTYLRVTSNTSSGGGQDSAHQQILPISALGNEYVGAGVVSRLGSGGPEDVPYRLLGVVDGTTLSYDPAPPPGAPTTLGAGQVVEFSSSQFFSVRSQDDAHPFSFTQYMTGTSGSSRPGCAPQYGSCQLGDEEWVVQLPPRQFLSRYVFFTDPTYGTTNLVLTRVRGPAGFSDVEIACLGTVTGWQPVGTSGDYEVAHVDLSRAFTGTTPDCATSRHEATSAGAFGVTVWGTDWYASYGYPAGGNVGTINDVVIPPVPQ